MEVDQRDSAQSLSELANSQFDQGRFREAEESYAKAIEILRAQNSEEGKHLLATCLSKMGDALFARNEPEKALHCYKESLPIMDSLFDDSHPEVMSMIYRMELVLDRIGTEEPDGKRVQWSTGSIPAIKAIEKASGIHQTVAAVEKSEMREKTKKSREERSASLEAVLHSGMTRNALFFILQFLCALVVMSSYIVLMQWYEHKKINIAFDEGPGAESFRLCDGSVRLVLQRDGTAQFDTIAPGSQMRMPAARRQVGRICR